MICTETHVSRYFSFQHKMVWHAIAKSRLTNLFFFFRFCSQNISKVSLKVYIMQHLCGFTVSPFSSLTLQPCSSRIMCLSFILGLMTEIISEQQKLTVFAFTASTNTEGFLRSFFVNMVSPGNNFTARFSNTDLIFFWSFSESCAQISELLLLLCFWICVPDFLWLRR